MHFAGGINTGRFIIRSNLSDPKGAPDLRLRNTNSRARSRALGNRVGLARQSVIVDVPAAELATLPAWKVYSH
jgi:hypothetical protein